MKKGKYMNPFIHRAEKVWDWMAEENISLVMFEDTEGRRDKSIEWLTGHPCDALLFLSIDKKIVLVPWDINLAKTHSIADFFIPYSEFGRSAIKAVAGVANMLEIMKGAKIEIPPVTPYPQFLNFVGELTDYDILCREKCAVLYVQKLRAIKEKAEIKIYWKAASVTNEIIDLVEKKVRNGKIKTEADAALLIEYEARKRGCDGTGFDIIAAGPERSYGIHAYPSFTRSSFGGTGLSILDFGIKLYGYTTDVTLTFVRDPKPQQEKMINYVERAYNLAISLIKDQKPVRELAQAVETFMARYKKTIPHGLGHGMGLDAHEYPIIKVRENDDTVLEKGMIFSIEPGLYDPVHGGCRLENDVLLTEDGPVVLTEARIIRL